MNLRSTAAAALALAALSACEPAVRGLCTSTKDCRQGASCAASGICLASSGTCAPACGEGEICSGSICAALKPVVSVRAPTGPLSPALPHVTVHVDAAVGIALHGIAVEVDNSLEAVASGSLSAPQAGDNLVTLSQFKFGAVGNVSVRATLRFQLAGPAEESISSVAVPAVIDDVPPSVSVFVPAASDAVNGWVPRTAGTLEVRATVDDGVGTGAQSATLSFDTCPAAAPCTYVGALISLGGGASLYSFTVPRTVQAAGSEAPLAVTVKAQDVAGNQGQGAGVVQIDDAPPQIGALGLFSTTGVTGEDGQTWFIGGSGAPDVEISVPVTDKGAGLSSLILHLTDPGVGGPDPAAMAQADGTVHFLLPARRVVGREGAMHFTLTATDLLQHAVTPPQGNIWVDAALPVFTRPHIDYASALPSGVCAAETSGSFNCGRRLATHALRDDTVTVTFDGFDCGAGLANAAAPFSLLVTAGGQSKTLAVQQSGKDTGTCTNGSTNRIHHFSVQVPLETAVTALGTPNPGGTAQVQLVSSGADRASNSAQSPAGGTSPDGTALISTWRWKIKLNAPASGSPALLPGQPGSRTVVVGTTATAGSNLFALGPDGTQLWSGLLLPDIVGDIAVGPGGTIYASTDSVCTATATGCAAINVVSPPAGATGTAVPCFAANATFGASPAVGAAGGNDLLYAIALSRGPGVGNLFAFTPGATCTQAGVSTPVTPIADSATGVTAGAGSVFVSNGHGFTSLDESGTGFGTQVIYQAGNASLVTPSPPSISSDGTAGGAIFGTGGGDQKVRRTLRVASGCGLPGTCWIAAPGFPPAQPPTPSNLPFTPVFDGQTIWAIDDQGVVFTWAQAGGAAGPSLDLAEAASPPVLLQGSAALEVTVGGLVKLISAASPSMSPVRLLDFGSGFTTKTPAPVIDCRSPACSGSGVAYAPAPAGWVYAVQLPAAPVAASSTVWPRPGHDSCNSRNAITDPSKCP